MSPGPVPGLARRILAACAPAAERGWLLADLAEEAAARAEVHGLAAARRWSWRQVLLSVVPLLGQRIGSALRLVRRTQMSMWRGLRSDLQIAWRRLLGAPGFAIVCILTLALGIGGNTAVFTLIDRVMLQPLPVARPHELVRLGGGDNCCVNTGLQRAFSLFSYDLYQHLREAVPEIADLAAFQANTASMIIGRPDGDEPPETLTSSYVSGNYFTLFGLVPAAGRLLAPEDDRPGASPVAVISHTTWVERYQANPGVAGSVVSLNGVRATIVGVAPEGFYGETLRPDATDLWVTLSSEPLLQPQARLLEQKSSHWLYALGRLAPDSPVAPLEARLSAALQQWIRANLDLGPDDMARVPEQHVDVVRAAGGVPNMRNEVAPSLKLLQAIAAAMLLVACANLANLLLARGLGQRTEIAVRIALGAPRARLMAQFLVESLLLSTLGGALGMIVSYAGARTIVDMTFRGATNIPVNPAPSFATVAFAFGVSVLTGVLFGVVPAILASRSEPMDAMRGAGRSTTERGSRVRRTLVAVQVALSLVLLASAGLLSRSLAGLQAQDFGFRSEGRYVVTLVSAFGGASATDLEPVYARAMTRLRQIPGVANAAMSLYAPMSGDNWSTPIIIDGHDPAERLSASWNRVTPAYFETIGTPLIRGRAFSYDDRPGSPLVTIVNETLARRFFGDGDPIGRHMGFSDGRGGGTRDYEIVGIVGDAKYQDPKGPAYATFFLPFLQTTNRAGAGTVPGRLDRSHLPRAIEIHVTAAVPRLGQEIRRALAEVDRRMTVRAVRPMSEQVAGNFNVERVISTLALAFGGIALLLACLGLYGVTAYAVTRRTREIGIRMAIGATRQRVLKTILASALTQLAAGLALGLPAALGAGRLLEANLFGVTPHDPATLASATAALAVCALVAALIPARRAATLDPVRALRIE